MSLRRTLATAAAVAALMGAGVLTAPAAQADPYVPKWVSYGPHSSYEHCLRIGHHLADDLGIINEWRCDSHWPYQLWALK
ncbi:hypothetical protein [Streptomyces sp. CAU 1734]|uniref:hypothetical protein n=1 Tax=Streptomyces sp. CAU 1734 TaxID=3140360 RepID=UPI003260C051